MSEHYNFDEASTNDLALTIGVEKTRAICDFVRISEGSNVEGAQATQVKDEGVKRESHETHGTGPQKNAESTVKGAQATTNFEGLVYNIPRVKDDSVKQEKHHTHATDPQKNDTSTSEHPNSQ